MSTEDIASEEEIRQYIRQGWSLVHYKKADRWALQKRMAGKLKTILLKKGLNKVCVKIKEEPKIKAEKTPAKLPSDAEHVEDVIDARVDSRKPIEEKTIESLAWYNNLIVDLGRYALHMIESEGLVSLEPEDYDDYEKAKPKFLDALDSLKSASKDAGRLMELERDYRFTEAEREFYAKAAAEYKSAYETAVSCMCDMCRQRFTQILLLSALGGVQA
jgi:hypothetical protein